MKFIGKYEVRGLLGRGGMGAVYKVRHASLGRIFALKKFSPQPALIALLGYDEVRKRFRAEARVLGKLRHENIITVFDFEETGDDIFFVMEYYCQNLGALIGESYDLEAKTRTLEFSRAVNYTLQTLAGLNKLHQSGIVHRDIKPYNLLLSENRNVKITDFGLSKLRGEHFSGSRRLHIGSPYYTAPEQERDPESAVIESDLYSAGVMLYRFLTGRLPMDSSDNVEKLNMLVNGDWIDFFKKAMAASPSERFSSANDMAETLKRLFEDSKLPDDAFCPPDDIFRRRPASYEMKKPRSIPVKARPFDAAAVFGLNELMQPAYRDVFHYESTSDLTLYDPSTGLRWRKGGSDFPLTFKEAQQYIIEMNKIRFDGVSTWRLPTVNELAGILIQPEKKGSPCIDDIFGRDKSIVWSSDRRSAMGAWYVNVEQGYVGWNDLTCYFHAVAVSDG